MIQTSFVLSNGLTKIYSYGQIKKGHELALRLLRISDPQKLRFNSRQKSSLQEPKRMVLMGHAARAKFTHLYPRGGTHEESTQAFDLFHDYCSKWLKEFPAPDQTDAFRKKIDFIYDWIIGLTKDRTRNYLLIFNPLPSGSAPGATLDSGTVRANINGHLKELAELASAKSPEIYYITHYLLVNPHLPFNIRIPF